MSLKPINLQPHRLWARRAHRRRFFVESMLLTAMLALVLVLLAVGLMVQRQSLEQTLVDQRESLAKLQAKVKRHHELQQSWLDLQSRRELVNKLWQQQAEVLSLWTHVARALPVGVYLTSLKLSPSGRSLSGVGANEAEALEFEKGLRWEEQGWRHFELIEVHVLPAIDSDMPVRKEFILSSAPTEPKGAP